MKIAKIALVMLLPICFCGSGCPPTNPISPIVGSWVSTTRALSGSSPVSFTDSKATFNANGTATIQGFELGLPSGTTFLVNYTTAGDKLTIITNTLLGSIVDTFSISGNMLSVISSGPTTTTFTRQ